MKKYLWSLAVLLVGTFVLVACDDDDNNKVTTHELQTDGIFVINSGNVSNQISGSITAMTPTFEVTQKAFYAVNGRNLGMNPNGAAVYGGRLYVAVTGENTIEVMDKHTLKSIHQIRTTDVIGSNKGKQPRCIVGYGNCIYVSTYDGYVAAIDTASFSLTKPYKVGSYPEGMDVDDHGFLYVANSDYGRGKNPSISTVNLSNGKVDSLKDASIMNPYAVKCDGTYGLYILDYGQYDQNWNQKDAGVRCIQSGKVSLITAATLMAVDTRRHRLYTINAPYTYPATPITYQVMDMEKGESRAFLTSGVDSPAAIAVDPVTGNVFIASYRINSDTGFADYNANCYINVYTSEGTLLKTVDCGLSPCAFAFAYSPVD